MLCVTEMKNVPDIQFISNLLLLAKLVNASESLYFKLMVQCPVYVGVVVSSYRHNAMMRFCSLSCLKV